jgi:hypothetical protein
MEPNKTHKDPVDEALDASFPASDPPAWNMGHDPLKPPRAEPAARRGPRGARRRHPVGKG